MDCEAAVIVKVVQSLLRFAFAHCHSCPSGVYLKNLNDQVSGLSGKTNESYMLP